MVNPRVELLYVLEKDQARYETVRERWGSRTPPNVQPEDSDRVMADPRLVQAEGVIVYVVTVYCWLQ